VRAAARGETYLSPAVSKHVIADYLRRTSGVPSGVGSLTPRQCEILRLVAEGLTTKAIARRLGISVKTVETHRTQLMDRLGISYRVMGGPTHCCGINQFRTGDVEMSGRMAMNTAEQLGNSKSGQVLSWCPSCYVQYTETTLPAMEKKNGSRPFEMTPFICFLASRLDDLRPELVRPVPLRVALHRHPGVTGVVEAAENILKCVPGTALVDLGQPAVGLQSFNLGTLPAYKRELQLAELKAAREAGVDALVTIYHSDHRELCAHERDWPFRIVNLLEIIGDSAGLEQSDRYKQLKLLQDADLIVAECSALVEQHGLDRKVARDVVIRAMLGDQPLPLTNAMDLG